MFVTCKPPYSFKRMLESFHNTANKNLSRTASFFSISQGQIYIMSTNMYTKTEVMTVITTKAFFSMRGK